MLKAAKGRPHGDSAIVNSSVGCWYCTVPEPNRTRLFEEIGEAIERAGGTIERVCQLGELEAEFQQADAADGGRSVDAFQSAWSSLVKAARSTGV